MSSIGWMNVSANKIRTDMIELYMDGVHSSFQDVIEQFHSIAYSATLERPYRPHLNIIMQHLNIIPPTLERRAAM